MFRLLGVFGFCFVFLFFVVLVVGVFLMMFLSWLFEMGLVGLGWD